MCALLLLAGTEILSWYWPVVIFGGAFLFGLWKVSKSMPGLYRLAQLIDTKLGFSDSLSTAFHFSNTPEGTPADFRDAVARNAEQLARTADLKTALPFSFPRSGYFAAALGLAVLTLFGIRYGITNSMDLKRPMITGAFQDFFSPPSDEIASNKTGPGQKQKQLPDELEKLGVPVNNPDTDKQAEDLDAGSDAALNTVDTPDVNPNAGSESAKTDSKDTPGQDSGKEEASDEAGGDTKGEGENQQGSDKQGKDQQNQDGKQESSQNDAKNSMLDKMRDALQNMMNKMKVQPKGGNEQQKASNSKDGNPSGKGQQKGEKQGEQQKGGEQQSGDAQDQKADAQGENGQKSEKAQGKSGEQQGQQQNAEAKSGTGKQDGEKAIKDAELAAAMGKLSEILGKRQQNLSGEVMIEVNSGKQQLKTSYTSQSGTHRESGGEIHRDEVPLVYQQYVERYFEQVRRPAAPVANPAANAAPAPVTPRPNVPPTSAMGTPPPAASAPAVPAGPARNN